jgi:hypothetical protein
VEKMKKSFAMVSLILAGTILISARPPAPAANQTASASSNLLVRRYQEGEKLTYHMKGINEQWQYAIQADGVVKKDAAGSFFEEYAWSNLVSNNQPVALPAASAEFRQVLSLAPDRVPSIPDLSKVHPMLIGPIADLLTFYSDLWLANRAAKFSREGDHFHVEHGTPSSWADGARVLLGEDSIDFDITLKNIDQAQQTATLLVRHVPPARPRVKLPADWMRAPVTDTPNNWVQVEKSIEGKYAAEVGKETFEVEIKVSLVNGKMLSAKMDNPVEVLKRECTDSALAACGPATRYQIRRQIELE